ncbi:MAG: Small-conductance mechanosensitive channel MscMJ [Methanoregula sp. PtaU1.Bin006]|uniref:mechanosensitive ion channel family protein n=1 Tax=Methanoregula sp. PtaU1.Bin006 TaxID=1811681 RepID=UPI0009D08C21|nr:mechanosensitive ion channel domain-containing protein [Methanoregula sp. PtaU1.Bin006]OPY32847.1 MAG: Small-conductance mechanosensitive channel MscMJ [Methanoregula sp. PtaU1.Bin006]
MDNGMMYAAVTVASGLVLAGLVHAVIRLLKNKAQATESQLDDIILAAIGTPLVVAIIALSAYIALTRFGVVPESLAWLVTDQVLNAVFILIAAWIISSLSYRLIHGYGTMVAAKTETDLDDRLVPILEIAARYLIWFVALVLILSDFRVDVTPLLAGAGIGALALALAAQDILGNLFGGVIIAVDKPFRIGDRVKVEEFFGDVMSIGLRSTRIKTLDSQIVTVPNSKITSSVVINYAMPDLKMKVRVPFSAAYGSDMEKVKTILLEIARDAAVKTSWVLTDPAPSVYFLEFGESSLKGQLILWTNNYDSIWDVQDWVNSRIARRFSDEKIEIPFRQVDVWMRPAGGSS